MKTSPKINMASNLKMVFAFRAGTYIALFLGLIPTFFYGYQAMTISIIAAVAVLILLAYILIKPSYYSIELANNKVYISTDKEGTDEYFLLVDQRDFLDYKIESKGIRKMLVVLKKEAGNYMLSKKLNISLSTSKHLENIEAVLGPLKQQHPIKFH
jgi:hypothetical protein